MKTSLLSAAAALLPLANAQQITSARPFFIYDTHPTGSLEASVISWEYYDATYLVSCPTADVACKKEGYWPARVTHQQGSHWEGMNTATAGTTKFWACNLGTGGGDVLPDQYGKCYVTTVASGKTTVDDMRPVNTCFVSARSVAVAITAGVEKAGPAQATEDAAYYMTILSQGLEEAGCSPFSSPAAAATLVKTTDSGAPTMGTTGSVSSPAQTGSGTASGTATATAVVSETEAQTPASSNTVAAPSGSTQASGSGRTLTSWSLMVGAGLAVAFM